MAGFRHRDVHNDTGIALYNSKRLQNITIEGVGAKILILEGQGAYLIAVPAGSKQMEAFQLQRSEIFSVSSKTLVYIAAVMFALGILILVIGHWTWIVPFIMGAFFIIGSVIYKMVADKKRKERA